MTQLSPRWHRERQMSSSSSWLDQRVQAKDDQRKLKPHNHDLSGKIKEPMMNLLKMGRCRD